MINSLDKKTANIEKKLAKRSLAADKSRNRLLMFTISLATCLVIVTALFFFFTQRKNLRAANGRYQVVFQDLKKEEIAELKNDSRLEVGASYLLGMLNMTDYKVTVRSMDENLLKLGKCRDIIGSLPKAVNEIALTEAYLDILDPTIKVSDTVRLNLGNGERDFVISGILPVDDASYSVYISEALIEELVDDPLYSAYINVPYTEGWSEYGIRTEIRSIAREYGLEEKQIDFSMFYFSLIKQRSSQYMLIIMGVAAVVAGACVLVVYSLFYVSIIRKTNEYGKLKTIGTSSKQIKKIIGREGNYLAILSIPIGAVLGIFAGYLLVPDGWNLPVGLLVASATGIFMYICVKITVGSPAKMASKLSPIEAVKYTAYSGVGKKRKKGKNYHISEKRLALLNFVRNKKKMILTVSSLGICGILLVGSAAYFDSISPLNMARQMFPYGEMKIELGNYGPQAYRSEDYFKLQMGNVLSEQMIQSIKNVEGVEDVLACEGTVIDVDIPTGYVDPFLINAYKPEDQRLVDNYLISGTADYSELIANNGVLIADSLWKGVYGWDPSIGDSLTVKTSDGENHTYTILGLFDANISFSGYRDIFMPESMLRELSGLENLTYQISIDIDEDKIEKAAQEIKNLFSINDSIYITYLSDWTDTYKDKLSNYRIPVYVLICIIGMFGFVNLLNTLVTNMIVRKREFGILQAVGLTDRQLSKVLSFEGMMYIICALIISLIFGTVVGIVICNILSSMSVFGEVRFVFPIKKATIYFAFMIVIQCIFTAKVITESKKQTIIDKIDD